MGGLPGEKHLFPLLYPLKVEEEGREGVLGKLPEQGGVINLMNEKAEGFKPFKEKLLQIDGFYEEVDGLGKEAEPFPKGRGGLLGLNSDSVGRTLQAESFQGQKGEAGSDFGEEEVQRSVIP